mgnify:FL=1|tara:strand:- start:514 stop:1101 length:588 start_codon:yes stop_codon:yes gene_type:complete
MNTDTTGQIHVLLGLPGSGKGTQATRICEDVDIIHLSSGDIFRRFAANSHSNHLYRRIREHIDCGELVPNDLACNIVMREIESIHREGKGVILDGFPRTLSQAEFLDERLSENDGHISSIINLAVSEETSLERILDRGRHDDLPEIAKKRLEVHLRLSDPVLDYYRCKGRLVEVDGDRAQDEVKTDLLRVMGVEI